MKDNIKVRIAHPDDAKELLSLYTPYVENTAITFEYNVPSEDEFRQRIINTLKKYPYLVTEKGGEILGYTYAGTFKNRPAYDWSVETTIYLKQDKKRLGIGRLLYEALEKALKVQGILNANACIAVPKSTDSHLTMDSIYFHQHIGYSMVGTFHNSGYKFNTWYDMVWMEKQIGNHTETQPPIKPFNEIINIVTF